VKLKTVLSIAGSDCSGGAGIQADLKTIAAHRLYGMSVITAVTAQNTLGVQGVFPLPVETVAAQLDSIFTDIFPDAVKIGMLCSAQITQAVAEKLKRYRPPHVIIDPVIASTGGTRLLSDEGIALLSTELFPIAELITPNIPEAHLLYQTLRRTNCAVLIKGGHTDSGADDILFDSGKNIRLPGTGTEPGSQVFHGTRIISSNTHGTGCTLSSAIACGRAQGCSLPESIRRAKCYVTGALQSELELGHGHGPLDHGWNR
jgi:hydroxymethylpyrimidine/phosphomethylpyrimidine kinase